MKLTKKNTQIDFDTRYSEFNLATNKGQEIQLPRGSGNFIYLLIKAINARHILQIGTFGGNNTLWLGYAATSTQGSVIALECDPQKTTIARLNIETAQLQKTVQIIDTNLTETVQKTQQPFDLVFLDAPVKDYLHFFELVFPKIRTGGILVSDRAISHKSELENYFNFIKCQKNLESILAPFGKGLILSYKN